MDNKAYRDRSPLVKDNAPRKTDNRGLPEPRSWRARRKSKIREYDKDNFNGGNIDDMKDSVVTEYNQSLQPEQPSMYEVEPNVEDLTSTDEVAGGQSNVTPNEKSENLTLFSVATPKKGKHIRRSKEDDNINELPLFDLLPGTQNTLFRV
jgi:hypothetical protein